jgi:hypothetical protein
MASMRDVNLQASARRQRIAARKRLVSWLNRAVDLFLIALAATAALGAFVLQGWVGLVITLAVIAGMVVLYWAIDWGHLALARYFVRRAVRRMQAAATSDTGRIQVDAWLTVGRGGLLIADTAKRTVLLHIKRVGWRAFRMDDLKRVEVIRRRTWFGATDTVLAVSDEYAGPPLLQMDVVEGAADHFAKIFGARIRASAPGAQGGA